MPWAKRAKKEIRETKVTPGRRVIRATPAKKATEEIRVIPDFPDRRVKKAIPGPRDGTEKTVLTVLFHTSE